MMPKLNGKQEGGKERLTFETMEEARNAFEESMYISQESYNQIMEKAFNQWLSEEKVTILSELKQ